MNRITLFVDVILPLPVKGFFTYRVPFELNNDIAIGKRVVVQFGRKKIYTALIHSIHQIPPTKYLPKYVLSVLDTTPVVNAIQFNFWEWLASYYMAYPGDVMNVSLPAGLKLQSESKIVLNPEFNKDYSSLNEKEFLVAEAVSLQQEITLSDVSRITGQAKIIPLIKTLIEKKIIVLKQELIEQYKPKKETYLRLTKEYQQEEMLHQALDDLSKRAYKQMELLLSYINLTSDTRHHNEEIKKSVLLKSVNAPPERINTLIKKGIFESFTKVISRLQHFESQLSPDEIQLTEHQQCAHNEINNALNQKEVVLLHGVTSSGKTELYIKFINETIKQGKQVLYLLPEIALTTQIINRLRKYFGDKIGVYHSKYNEYERVEIWNQVLKFNPDSNETDSMYQIILGARSALLLPYQNLGLIIIDEEHDTSYKQYDPAPRYHARDAGLYLARLHQAKTILGSATPSIESYYNALNGKFGLVELSQRYGGIQLPEIKVVNIRKESRQKKMKSIFSSTLLEQIGESLTNNEQVILFQNRRGFSLRLECETCNWMPECQFCDVTLIYHKHDNQLRCHYCGYHTNVPAHCPECKSTNLKMQGFGTEKIEEELAIFFPDAKISRMDLDTTRSKNAHQRIITDFEDQKIDILVGTQMITKGLDFDHVRLVSILNADNLINFPDFRSYERSYQLMAQVSGRAGRKQKRGKVLIQSFTPDHFVIKSVIENDYTGMYNQQIIDRKKYKYPPYYRLILLKVKHKDPRILNKAAYNLARMLKNKFQNRVLGPEYPIVSRIKNMYIKHILIKLVRGSQIEVAKSIILNEIDNFHKPADYKSVRVVIDVDPQ